MTDARRRSIGRVWLIAGIALMLWALVIAVTGGFRIEAGPVRISSRNFTRIFLLAVLALAGAWRVGYQAQVEEWTRRHAARIHQLAPVIAWASAATLLIVGILCGSRAASASDPFGYVSQSTLWQRRTLRIDYAFAARLPWPEASQTLAPLGYKVAPDSFMVPTYAPGVPLLMAAGRIVSACGPFLVGLLSGAALVLFTFYLGRAVVGPAAAAAAAMLVACSPVVVFMTLLPMADVPAAAFWVGALAAATGRARWHPLAAGLSTGVAILIRPNLAPLAVFPWLMTLSRGQDLRGAVIKTALFGVVSVPCALAVGWVNDHLYGSPLISGYGDLRGAFSWSNAAVNIGHYGAWWWESQGPLGLLFLVALWNRRRGREFVILTGFALTVLLLYLFYLPFDAWRSLRFLLPAVPVFFLLSADAARSLARSLSTARVALVAFIAIAASHAIRFNDLHDVTRTGADEERYVQPALFMDATIPPAATVLTVHHSGSIRYYAGRLTLRWDLLDPAWLDRAVEDFHRRGIPTYLFMEYFEVQQFEERFKGQKTLAVLQSTPLAVGRAGEQRLFALGSPYDGTPASIPEGGDRHCRDISPGFFHPAAIDRLR